MMIEGHIKCEKEYAGSHKGQVMLSLDGMKFIGWDNFLASKIKASNHDFVRAESDLPMVVHDFISQFLCLKSFRLRGYVED